MRRTKAMAVVAGLALTGAVLAGCGGGAEPEAGGVAEAPGMTGTTPAAEASGTPEVPEDMCAITTAAEVGAAVGGTATLETGPMGDCEFSQEDDLRAPSGSFGLLPYADANGGYPAYLAGMSASIKDAEKHEIPGVGDAAAVYVGVPAMGSGENLMAGAAADLGDRVVTVTIVQGNGIDEDRLVGIATGLVTLVARAVG